MDIGIVVAFVAVIFLAVIVAKGIRVVQQSEVMIIESFGSYSRTLKNGLNITIPIRDEPRQVYWVHNSKMVLTTRLDMRETVLDVPEQSVITRDNVSINIDALLYVQILDPVKVAYEISNLPLAVAQLTQTSLRNVIGEMDLDHTLASRDVINSKLKAVLDEASEKWGVTINRVEIKNIFPPREIQLAMEKQMQAERERRAKVLEAEGDKQSRIARSEGVKQEQINLAEGAKEAEFRRAEGQAFAIKSVAEAQRDAILGVKQALGDAQLTAQYLTSANYLEKLGNFVTKPGDKVFVPYEASTALGALGSVKALLDRPKSV